MPEPNRAPLIAAIPVALGLAAAGLQVTENAGSPAVIRPERGDVQETLASFTDTERKLIEEHVFGGLPSTRNVHVRQGYVMGYLPEARIPAWVAYHVEPDYRDTPPREGRFSTFRKDPDVDNAVVDRDYTGLLATRGYARGHLAPYGVMGGDRDHDGELAPDDDFDNETVFEAMYMSNIAPQIQTDFNSGHGLWYQLERKLQDVWVSEQGNQVWVFAGCIVGPGDHEFVGPDNDILVPPMFFKIVIKKPPENNDEGDDLPQVLAFLFPHQRVQHGNLEDYLVTVDVIEALSNLDFFNELGDGVERVLEDTDTIVNWPKFEGGGDADTGDGEGPAP